MKNTKIIEKINYLIEKKFYGNTSELARKIGVSPQNLRKYLLGEKNFGAKTIKKFEIIGVDLDWLLNEQAPVEVNFVNEPISKYVTKKEFEEEIKNLKAKLYDTIEQKDNWKNFAVGLWNYTQTQLNQKDNELTSKNDEIERLSFLFARLLALDGKIDSGLNDTN